MNVAEGAWTVISGVGVQPTKKVMIRTRKMGKSLGFKAERIIPEQENPRIMILHPAFSSSSIHFPRPPLRGVSNLVSLYLGAVWLD